METFLYKYISNLFERRQVVSVRGSDLTSNETRQKKLKEQSVQATSVPDLKAFS
jgi:hypothetical protein